jgi:hypothetical protein
MLFALLTLTACESLEERGQYLTGPDVIEWKNGDAYTIKGQKDMRGGASVSSAGMYAYLTGFPPGTELRAGEHAVTASEHGAANLDAPVTAFYGTVSTSDMLEGTVEGIVLTITAPGGEAIPVPLPPQTVYLLEDHLATVGDGPLLYVGEDATDGAIDTIYWQYGTDHYFLGEPAPTLADVDAVAVESQTEVSVLTCPGYVGDDGVERDLAVGQMQTTVQVYGRRSGKVLHTQVFEPIPGCPTSVFTFDDDAFKTTSNMPTEQIRVWLTQLNQPPAPPTPAE